MQQSVPMSGLSIWTQRAIRSGWIGRSLLLAIGAAALVILAMRFRESPSIFIQQVVNGIQLGFVYALIALGYTMVYGIVRLINFAHGDVFMVGSFVSYYAVSRFGLHLWPVALAGRDAPGWLISVIGTPEDPGWFTLLIGSASVILLCMVVCALLAVTIERVAYKPLRDAPRISALITAIGVSFFLEYFGALQFVFTPSFITYKRPFGVTTWYISDGIHQVQKGTAPPEGSVLFSNILVIIVLTSLLLLVLLQFIVQRTKIGKAMRATAYDKPTARLMGINVDRVISITFAIGAALAGAAGMLYAIAFPQIVFWMGIIPGLRGCGAGRHREHPRGVGGRPGDGPGRGVERGVYLDPDARCGGLRHLDHRAPGAPDRHLW
jgi:branched-chain amino acid transport system permease protein